MYSCVATSIEAFVQQLAVGYVARGYYFYVARQIPLEKDPSKTDRKIIGQYSIDISRWARLRRKREKEANVQYLRHGHFFVIIATGGQHPFFEQERGQIKDIREHPLRFHGYSISCRKGWYEQKPHASVRIDKERYLELKEHFLEICPHLTVEELSAELRRIPFQPYAPIRNQFFMILRAVNRKRHLAGLEKVPNSALRRFRKTTRVFECASEEGSGGEQGDPGFDAAQAPVNEDSETRCVR